MDKVREKVLEALGGDKTLTFSQLAFAIGVTTDSEERQMNSVLGDLLDEEVIDEDRYSKFKLK